MNISSPTPFHQALTAPLEIKGFSGPFRFLSNFYESPVVWDGVLYPTVEHAYQASKTLDTEERKIIEHEASPGKVKRLGRKITLRKDWDEVKISVMTGLVHQKFQHNELKQQLLDTQNAYIEETNHWGDTFWGVCQGEGSNHLGQILMDCRATLASQHNTSPPRSAKGPQ